MSPMSSGFYLRRYVAGALCALLLLSGSSWPVSGADRKPLNAILIVARLEEFAYGEATAIAVVLLIISFAMLLLINRLERWSMRHEH